jgi:hypothetical protein
MTFRGESMHWILIPFSLFGCTSETEPQKPNKAPSVEIQSHTGGEEFEEGIPIGFYAMASDADNANGELSAAWYVDGAIVCEWAAPDQGGVTACETALDAGTTQIAVVVQDPAQEGARAELEVTVFATEAPEAGIISPILEGTYYSDQLVSFSAQVSDVEDAPEDLSIRWESSLDGPLPMEPDADENGETEELTYLSEGEHIIKLTVEDSGGKTAEESVLIQVGAPNTAPSCAITEPAEGGTASVGQGVVFRGTAVDPDVYNDLLQVQWESDKDGIFGEVAPNTAGEVAYSYSGLSAETHNITMRVTDDAGGLCSDSILFTIGSGPTVVLTSPSDGDILPFGESTLFSAEVSAGDGMPEMVGLEWTSDVDGLLSSQGAGSSGTASFSTSGLSAGMHTVTVVATDPGGLAANDQSTFRVNTPPPVPEVSLAPEAPATGDSITATAAIGVDGDGDTLTLVYAWLQDGAATAYAAAVLPASATAKGEVWTVMVAGNDGYVDGDAAEASTTIANTAPTISSPSISPASPSNTDLVTCTASAADPDEVPDMDYTWTLVETGATLGTGATLQLTPLMASDGENVQCDATATDSDLESDSASASVTVVVSGLQFTQGATITPASGVTVYDTLECMAAAMDEAELPLALDYEWSTSGAILGTSLASSTGTQLYIPATGLLAGSTIQCSATATDPTGSITSTASVTIDNALPSITQLDVVSDNIDPAVALTDSVLEATAATDDPEGDPVTVAYAWMVDGVEVAETGSSLDGAVYFDRGQEVQLVATPSDATSTGVAVASALFTVANSPPTEPSVTVSPSPADTSQDIECTAGASTDADGDPITYVYEWTLDGLAWTGATTNSGQTIPSSETATGDHWTCTVTADDGLDSASGSDTSNIPGLCPDDDGDSYDCDDCNDTDPFTYPGAAYLESATDCMRDADGDGWGDDLSDDCCYSLEMTDLTGNGWEGAFLQLFDDGSFIGSYTVNAGGSESALLCVADGHLLSLSYTDGANEADNTYTLRSPDGDLLLFQGPIPSRGQVYSEIVDYSVLDSCGLTIEGSDCDDTDATLNNDDSDGDGSSSCDGDCMDGDGSIDPATDDDADGFTYCEDCDDSDSHAYPGAAYSEPVHACMRDADGDGWGDDLSRECCYRLEMQDSYNGIWDGAYLEAFADGVSMGTYAADSVGVVAQDLCVADGSTLTLEYTQGTYEAENSFSVYAPDGTLLVSDGPSPAAGLALGETLQYSDYPDCFQGEAGQDCDDSDSGENMDDLDGDGIATCDAISTYTGTYTGTYSIALSLVDGTFCSCASSPLTIEIDTGVIQAAQGTQCLMSCGLNTNVRFEGTVDESGVSAGEVFEEDSFVYDLPWEGTFSGGVTGTGSFTGIGVSTAQGTGDIYGSFTVSQ